VRREEDGTASWWRSDGTRLPRRSFAAPPDHRTPTCYASRGVLSDRRPAGLSRGGPNGIRTRVSTLRGWCPGPLDDGTVASSPEDYPRRERRLGGSEEAIDRRDQLLHLLVTAAVGQGLAHAGPDVVVEQEDARLFRRYRRKTA